MPTPFACVAATAPRPPSIFCSCPAVHLIQACPLIQRPTSRSTSISSPFMAPSPPAKKPLISVAFIKTYLPFIVFIAIALILLVSIIFIPARTVTKLFAASTALAWTSLWATVSYLLCLGGNTFIAWFVISVALFLWIIITVMVFIGAINLDATTGAGGGSGTPVG